MNENIASAAQSLAPGDRIALFTLDLSPIGINEAWRFTNSVGTGGVVNFQGQSYYPADVQVEGFEYNGQGQLPQPKVRISNATLFLAGTAIANGDLIGANFIRIRTFRQFLDDGVSADEAACFAPDIYCVEQKSAMNKLYIEWTLSARMDQQGIQLPRRLVYRDTCTYRYRRWTGTAWDYSKATCPYSGGGCFTRNRVPTGPAGDVCGKMLADCKARYGQAVLPFGGFPGVSSVKASSS
jgi:lambda family phage minor tail protein L